MKFIKQNKLFLVIVAIYACLMLSIISWGIPSLFHPYNYHMDEEHQIQAVRDLFKYGTPNIPGAAHGTILQFFLSGIYLIPFYILHIINPFAVKSGLSSYPMQAKIFEVLRLNTLLFGVLSLFVLNQIVKKYFKINPAFSLIIFTLTPLWLGLSNYFKYDIALTFWIITSIYFILEFGTNPTFRNYIIAGIVCSLALDTKISAIPLFILYIFSFFYFSKKRKYKQLLTGVTVFILIFLIFGIPDVLLGKADYKEFLTSNLIQPATDLKNYVLDYQPWWLYIFIVVMPIDFGHGFFILSILAIFYWIALILKKLPKEKQIRKNILFVLLSLLVFTASLWQLKLGANGNRLLVLLPFFAILTGCFLSRLINNVSNKKKIAISIVLTIVFLIQAFEALAITATKWSTDVRQSSSIWILHNIKQQSTIGIENIPIYQLLPDIALKEFYEKQANPKLKTNYKYEVIDASSKNLPNIIIITNRELFTNNFIKSPKKDLLKRMSKEKYVIKKEFKPSEILYLVMKNEFRMFISGLVPIPTITIYTKGNI